MLRKLRRRINQALHRLGFAPAFLLLAACRCQPLPEPNPGSTGTSTTGAPDLAAQCADACEFYRANKCTEADTVCASDGFDETGECVRTVSCEQACEESPDYYLAKECEP